MKGAWQWKRGCVCGFSQLSMQIAKLSAMNNAHHFPLTHVAVTFCCKNMSVVVNWEMC